MNDSLYVVCDRCGWLRGGAPSEPTYFDCPDCGSNAAWVFPSEDKARQYQAQVRDARQQNSPDVVS